MKESRVSQGETNKGMMSERWEKQGIEDLMGTENSGNYSKIDGTEGFKEKNDMTELIFKGSSGF
jgi:hypothetical protein